MSSVRSLPRRVVASSFVRVVGQSFAVRLFGSVVALAVAVVVARALGPQGRGAYAVTAAAATMGVQFGSLGLHSANTHFASRSRSTAAELFGNTLLVGSLTALATAGIAVVLVGVVAPISLVHGGTLLATALWVAAGLMFLLLQSLLLGLGNTRAYNSSEIVSKVVLVLGVGVIMAVGRPSVLVFVVVSALGVCVGAAWLLRALARGGYRPARPDTRLLRSSLHYGLRTYITALFSFALLRADTFMVQRYLGEQQTGFYSVAVSMADVLFILPAVVGALALARLSSVSEETQRTAQAVRIAFGLGMVMALMAAATGVVAGPLIRILFGSAFEPSVDALLWLLPGVVLLSVNIVLNNLFAASGMPWLMVWAPSTLVALNIGLNTVIIPRYGIDGAAWNSSLCYGLQLVLSCAYLLATRHSRARVR